MISSILSRLVILLFGTLYPAYSSYKAIRTKNVKEYVKWMMYWVVFALFTCAETFTDLFFSFWFPFYYEFKIILVVYLLSPATNGSSILYKKFVHPTLTRKEEEIDEYISKAMQQGYHTMLNLGSRSVAYATSIIMQTAIKGSGGLVGQIRKSYSLDDIDSRVDVRNRKLEGSETTEEETEGEGRRTTRRRRNYSPRRTVSSGSQVDLYFGEVEDRRLVPGHEISANHVMDDASSGYSSIEPYYASLKPGPVEQNVVRTSSTGPVTRTRGRAGLAKKPNSAEDESGWSTTTEPDESQTETDSCCNYPVSPLQTPRDFLDPFVRPEYRYLFRNLTGEQICALVRNASPTSVESHGESEGTDSRVASPSTLLRSIITDEGDEGSDEKVRRSGRWKKRPAPPVPVDDDDDSGEFCTPEDSPSETRKPSVETVEEVVAAEQPEKVVKDEGKKSRKKSKLHLPKFAFWKHAGKQSSETSSLAGMSRNSSVASLASRAGEEAKAGEEVSKEEEVREMSQSPSSKRRSLRVDS